MHAPYSNALRPLCHRSREHPRLYRWIAVDLGMTNRRSDTLRKNGSRRWMCPPRVNLAMRLWRNGLFEAACAAALTQAPTPRDARMGA